MKIALVGYGAMGKIVKEMGQDKIAYSCDMDSNADIENLNQIKEEIDVILDFSNPANLDMIYEYAILKKLPVVFATTGYNVAQELKISELSKIVPVLRSSNFSLGVILMNKLVKQLTPILKDSFDIEIIEAHHNRKLDAPSGTAKMLLDSVVEVTGYHPVYGRSGIAKRETNEIGLHSIRGGSIVGEHEVMYCGEDEIISLKHSAHSRKIFAKGALLACEFLQNQKPGLYDMEDVLFKERK